MSSEAVLPQTESNESSSSESEQFNKFEQRLLTTYCQKKKDFRSSLLLRFKTRQSSIELAIQEDVKKKKKKYETKGFQPHMSQALLSFLQYNLATVVTPSLHLLSAFHACQGQKQVDTRVYERNRRYSSDTHHFQERG